MKWIEPSYSKEKVKKAGNALVISEIDSDDFKLATPVLHNWRSSHAFPMQIMLDLLRKHSIKIDRNSFVVQRLKRVQSIYEKLYREKNMSLSRMQDIAGCRAVVEDVKKVNKIYASLKRSRTKNILHREYNYITKPKDSGYRGIHLIYKYNGGKEKYVGMQVELQIRSKVQHSWATAVEVVGAFTKQALKASAGDPRWLDLFKLVSVEFSKLESCPIDEKYNNVEVFSDMNDLIIDLGVRVRLSAFKVATKALTTDKEKEKGAGYFVLLLDMEEKFVRYTRFSKDQLSKATDYYNNLESKNEGDSSKDVVLVSAASVRDLKKAYPNYFADTGEFEKNLDKVYFKAAVPINSISPHSSNNIQPPTFHTG